MKKQFDSLVAELRSKNGVKRKRARNALVKIRKPSVPFLIDLMTDPNDHVRWEACKALLNIKDLTAAIPSTVALSDENSDVRWLAAEALIAIKKEAIIPLLQTLEENFDSPEVRQGAHHVLNALAKQNLLNQDTIAIIDKLDFPEPYSSVVCAVQKVLSSIGMTGKKL